jgi:RND family efflux transporter MFP subunit
MAGAALALALGLPATAGSDTPGSTSVATLTVAAEDASRDLSLSGRIEAVRQATVAAQVAGTVLAIAVKAGDRVRTGQLLARIDERSADAGVQAASAGVSQADALWQAARQHVERTEALRQQGFVSAAAVDEAQTRLRAAQAGLEQARAGRAQAQVHQGYATVRAPFDGVVLATHAEAGDLAAPGRPLLTVYAPGRLRAVVDVPASRQASARAARSIEVTTADGQRWLPVGRTELPGADPVAQTTEWRLELAPEAAAALQPGASVDVRFNGTTSPAPAGSAARLRLPAAAVLRRGEVTAVYRVQDGRFALQPVRLAGPLAGSTVDVVAGLRPGDRIAADAVRAGLAGAQPAR